MSSISLAEVWGTRQPGVPCFWQQPDVGMTFWLGIAAVRVSV